MDDAAAAGPASVVAQQHICILFQKVFLRGLDDVLGADWDSTQHSQKRRERH